MSGALTDTSILAGAAGAGAQVKIIDQSCIFNEADSTYLAKTFSSAGDRLKWTFSCWVKRGELGANISLFSPPGDLILGFSSDSDKFIFYQNGGTDFQLRTNALFRDTSAWYHFVVTYDSAQGTAADRIKIYVNGDRITSFSHQTNPSQNLQSSWNNNVAHRIGNSVDYTYLYDGYLAEVHFIDGTAFTAAKFGQANEDTNQWEALVYTGGYGTNGFYLKFEDSSDFGNDSSANSNDFTVVNLVAADQAADTPTASSSSYNMPTFNTLSPMTNVGYTQGNLAMTTSSAVGRCGRTTIPIPEGKWVYEYYLTIANSAWYMAGMQKEGDTQDAHCGYTPNSYSFYLGNGKKVNNSTQTTWGNSVTTAGKTVMIAIHRNGTSLKIWAGHDQASTGTIVWQASGDPANNTNPMYDVTIAVTDTWWMAAGNDGNLTQTCGLQNFSNQPAFTLTVPTNYNALTLANLAAVSGSPGMPAITLPGEYFNTVLYTGNDADRNITGVGFQPDITIIKADAAGYNWNWMDSARGPTKSIKSNSTAAQVTLPADTFQAFLSDGFELGADASNLEFNTNGQAYVSWNWKAGGAPTATNSAGAGNVPTAGSVKINGSNSGAALAGTIPATKLSANTTSGFSIITFEGTGSNATVAHGLSVTPELVMVKCLDTLNEWPVGSTAGIMDFTDYLAIDKNEAIRDDDRPWNDTNPTSSVFSLGSYDGTNNSGDSHAAYCFHSIEGYSKIGSYKGNGLADGTFIYTGFRPKFFFTKNVTQAEYWILWDGVFEPYNKMTKKWSFNDAGAAYVGNTTTYAFDMLSNGVKMRSSYSAINDSGDNFLFMAFAEFPFKYSNAR